MVNKLSLQQFIKDLQSDYQFYDNLIQFQWKISSEYLQVTPLPVYIRNDNEQVATLNIPNERIELPNNVLENPILIKKTILHELRHYYQLIYTQNNPDDELSKKWQENFKDYYVPSLIDEDNLKYALQAIEIDAAAFSQHVIYELFGVKLTHENKVIQSEIENYLKRIKFTKRDKQQIKKDYQEIEKINQEFIKHFGKDKFSEEVMLEKLYPYLYMINRDLNLELIPVIFDEIKEDSKFDLKEIISLFQLFSKKIFWKP